VDAVAEDPVAEAVQRLKKRPIVWSQGEQRPQFADPEFCLPLAFLTPCLSVLAWWWIFAIDYLNDNDEDDCRTRRKSPLGDAIGLSIMPSPFLPVSIPHRPSRFIPLWISTAPPPDFPSVCAPHRDIP